MTPHPEALPLQVKLSGVRQQRGGGGGGGLFWVVWGERVKGKRWSDSPSGPS